MGAEEVMADGLMLSCLDSGFVNYAADYPEFSESLALEVPVEGLKDSKSKKQYHTH